MAGSGGSCGGIGDVWQGVCGRGCMAGERGYMAGERGCMAGERGCMAGGAWQGGVHAWHERQALQQSIHVVLECILVH